MENLSTIIDRINQAFEAKNVARDQALKRSRELIRYCSLSIRASHRHDFDEASVLMAQAKDLAVDLATDLDPFPDLLHAGYTRDALKELAEAHIIYAIIHRDPLPEPDDLGVPFDAYLGGLAEAAGECRRFILDLVRRDQIDETEDLFAAMDTIYSVLVTVDFPDAITGGLRRQTDMVRGVLERTRGDLTIAVRQRNLEQALKTVERNVTDRA